jgi:hypothetical protein
MLYEAPRREGILRRGDRAPRIIILGITCMWAFSFKPELPYFLVPFGKRSWVGPKSRASDRANIDMGGIWV